MRILGLWTLWRRLVASQYPSSSRIFPWIAVPSTQLYFFPIPRHLQRSLLPYSPFLSTSACQSTLSLMRCSNVGKILHTSYYISKACKLCDARIRLLMMRWSVGWFGSIFGVTGKVTIHPFRIIYLYFWGLLKISWTAPTMKFCPSNRTPTYAE